MKKLVALTPFAGGSRTPKRNTAAHALHRRLDLNLKRHIPLIAVTALVIAGSMSSHLDSTTHTLIVAIMGGKVCD